MYLRRYSLPLIISSLIVIVTTSQCIDDKPQEKPKTHGTPYNWVNPKGFPTPILPADNPLTYEGIELGRHLFFDKRLSGNLEISCASCHKPEFFFSDPTPISTGVDGRKGTRNAMPLFNLAWQEFFFWDGRVKDLEEQSLHPIQDINEMDAELPIVISRLSTDSVYPEMFRAAFGDKNINADRIAKALAQFERTIVSSNSEFDRVKRMTGDINNPFIDEPGKGSKNSGFEMFNMDFPPSGIRGGNCQHCHGAQETGFLMGSFGDEANQFKNNGLKADHLADLGRYLETGKEQDKGKFKIPSVRNISGTFPYMHDGSVSHDGNMMELIEFYNSGIHQQSKNIDPVMHEFGFVDKKWTEAEKKDLRAFLETLTDDSLRDNPRFQNPFER